MFAIDRPYCSDLLLKTLQDNEFPVLKNDYLDAISKKYNLNYVEKIELSNKLYTNSENSLELILKTFKNTELETYIKFCKNKSLFREKLQTIYPDFFFKSILYEDLDKLNIEEIKFPFIIKPSVGFLSAGVHKVNSKGEWTTVLTQLKNEVTDFEKLFPKNVLNSAEFIIEELMFGEEYAIDTYFNEDGNPVILNIFKHPFADGNDVSDRIYLTSKKIINNKLQDFTKMLKNIGKTFGFKNFPMHIEVIENKAGQIIPVEINPLRFAGWCTTDLAYFAYGINIYEYYFNQKEPDWDKILSNKGSETYYFAMADVPNDVENKKIKSFDYNRLKQIFSNILEFRQIDYKNNPLFAILFGSTKSETEIKKILKADMKKFINL